MKQVMKVDPTWDARIGADVADNIGRYKDKHWNLIKFKIACKNMKLFPDMSLV